MEIYTHFLPDLAAPNDLAGATVVVIDVLRATTTIVQSRDPVLLEALLGGQAFLNGLAGEEWSRLIGGRFD